MYIGFITLLERKILGFSQLRKGFLVLLILERALACIQSYVFTILSPVLNSVR
jgi:hypothetical protein